MNHPTKNMDKNAHSGYVIPLVLAIVVVALVVRILPDTPDHPPFFDDTVTHVDTLPEAQRLTDVPIAVPAHHTDNVHRIGVYTNEQGAEPRGSVKIIFSEHDWRSFQLRFIPHQTIEQHIPNNAETEQVQLNDIEGTFFRSPIKTICFQPTEDLIGRCTLMRAVVFAWNGSVIAVEADGERLSDGELIMIARETVSALQK